MRTIEEIKKDQDQAIFELGAYIANSERLKWRIFKLAQEAEDLEKQTEKKEEKNESTDIKT